MKMPPILQLVNALPRLFSIGDIGSLLASASKSDIQNNELKMSITASVR